MKSIQYEGTLIQPTKIVCVGRNYVAHIEELNNMVPDQPVIFIKPNSAISKQIHITTDEDIHYEGEISFLIKNKQISAVGFGLDLTKRTVQSQLKEKGLPWERAKAFDGSAIFSEFKMLESNVENLRLELHINDNLIQHGGCDLMLFKPDDILKDVSRFLSLEDGDIIMTGTPAGVGKIHAGDMFLGKIYNKDQLLVEQSWSVS